MLVAVASMRGGKRGSDEDRKQAKITKLITQGEQTTTALLNTIGQHIDHFGGINAAAALNR